MSMVRDLIPVLFIDSLSRQHGHILHMYVQLRNILTEVRVAGMGFHLIVHKFSASAERNG